MRRPSSTSTSCRGLPALPATVSSTTDNKVLSENSLLGKTMEMEKKGKSRGVNVETEDEDEQEDAKR